MHCMSRTSGTVSEVSRRAKGRKSPSKSHLELQRTYCRPRRAYRGWRDAKALSNPRQRDAKLNELPKQIFMLLPLLLLLLLLLYTMLVK